VDVVGERGGPGQLGGVEGARREVPGRVVGVGRLHPTLCGGAGEAPGRVVGVRLGCRRGGDGAVGVALHPGHGGEQVVAEVGVGGDGGVGGAGDGVGDGRRGGGGE